MFNLNIIKSNKKILQQRVDNLNRKIIHIISAIIIFFFPYFLNLEQIIFISLLFALIFSLASVYNILPIINRVKRTSFGDIFYPLGIMISAIIFLPENIMFFQFGVLVLGFSDALANIVGDFFGTHRFKSRLGTKSLEGSLAFFISTLLLIIIFQGPFFVSNFLIYLLIAIILTLIEFFFFLGLDNLFLPVLASYFLSLL